MTKEEAIKLNQETGKSVTFSTELEVGTILECGCIEHGTVLSDGSLGWGGWTTPCSFEHMNN